MYVFGDSTLDVGNNNYLPVAHVRRANRPYYGDDFPGGVPTGRFSNGYNTADFIAKCIGLVSSPPPYLSLVAPASSGGLLVPTAFTIGVSYASGAAGILDSTNAGKCIPLSTQVQYFSATKTKMVAAVGAAAVNKLLADSIILMGIASNDMFVFTAAEQSRNRSAAEQQTDAAALYADLLSIYSATITLAAGFDDALGPLLAGLAARVPGLVYSLADSFRLTQDTFADPGASGYTDITGACCGSGRLLAQADCLPNSTVCTDHDGHVFWDRYHPAQRACLLTAQAFYDGPAQYTSPINFMQLAQSS
ncbi:unnamed protein product [Miscanthus lutarioriparius]|uniref:GDSL esterase/lipase n=1 Tax=Miscanthus lutarioriparius TaxID=422564 RepID=A0A811S2R8_9POAL|nr:unnamed protein product [Miscanthus lutarioriparius]